MKKLFFVAFILFTGCAFTNQQKAEKLIKAYLNEHLNDPRNYESVSFSKLDTIKTNFLDDKTYNNANDSLELIVAQLSKTRSSLKFPGTYDPNKEKSLLAHLLEDSASYTAKKDSIEKNYSGTPIRWSITHTYRAMNRFGALELHQTIFEINLACDSVVLVGNSR